MSETPRDDVRASMFGPALHSTCFVCGANRRHVTYERLGEQYRVVCPACGIFWAEVVEGRMVTCGIVVELEHNGGLTDSDREAIATRGSSPPDECNVDVDNVVEMRSQERVGRDLHPAGRRGLPVSERRAQGFSPADTHVEGARVFATSGPRPGSIVALRRSIYLVARRVTTVARGLVIMWKGLN